MKQWINDIIKSAKNVSANVRSIVSSRIRSNDPQEGVPMSDSMDDRYFVDFRPDRFKSIGYEDSGDMSITRIANEVPEDGIKESGEPKKKIHVPVTPKSVVDELERLPTHFSLEGLDQKIGLLKMKKELIRQHYASREVEGLILCLENRKKYDSKSEVAGVTYREFFARFDTTDGQRIARFLKKHELVMEDADIFIPEFPDDAIITIDIFTKICEELCEKKPQLYVIASKSQFRKAYGKRDPILLAQSPFGFYYYILGAWDEEMLYLPEL